jgi:hypothetical protein
VSVRWRGCVRCRAIILSTITAKAAVPPRQYRNDINHKPPADIFLPKIAELQVIKILLPFLSMQTVQVTPANTMDATDARLC